MMSCTNGISELFQSVSLEFAVESASAQAQPSRRQRPVALRLLQRPGDEFFFCLLQCEVAAGQQLPGIGRGRRVAHGGWQVAGADLLAAAQNDSMLDGGA